jgi:simple sugar transport system ATP-binding protein
MVKAAVELQGISKRFGRVVANDAVSMTVAEGTIHALVGENGAGKTTLMRILYGLYQADSGVIRVDGEEVRFRSPHAALRHGLGMVHQHFMLVPPLTVAENITLGREPMRGPAFDTRRAEGEVAELSQRYGLKVDPAAKVENLSVGEEQRVEILKALYRGARILILDEPTAVLTPQEVDELFTVLRSFKEAGNTVILITHKLREVVEVSDLVTVMRGGKAVGDRVTAQTSIPELAELMVGRPVLLEVDKRPARPRQTLLQVEKLEVQNDRGLTAVADISFTVRSGEIVGIAGVEGNGQAELIEALSGLRPPVSGKTQIRDRDITRSTPLECFRAGLAHIPADRLKRGLVAEYSLADNLILGRQRDHPFAKGPILVRSAIADNAGDALQTYDVRPALPEAQARTLSGGNQQKLIVARELSRHARVLLAAHPTRGVDLGAIEFIHRQLVAHRDRGMGLLLVSSELSELLSLADRLLVLFEGRIVYETTPIETDERIIGLYMSGHRTGPGPGLPADPGSRT